MNPLERRALALQAVTTPLVDAEAALNVLSDVLVEQDIYVPWFGPEAPETRTPLENALEYAISEWRPRLLKVEGWHRVEIIDAHLRAVGDGTLWFMALFKAYDAELGGERLWLHQVKLSDNPYARLDTLFRRLVVSVIHDEWFIDMNLGRDLTWLHVKAQETGKGRPYCVRRWCTDKEREVEPYKSMVNVKTRIVEFDTETRRVQPGSLAP